MLLNDEGLKKDLKAKKDFRPVNKVVWEYLWVHYRGGPVIACKVPLGFDFQSYQKGTWIKKLDLQHHTIIVYPSVNPKGTYSTSPNQNNEERSTDTTNIMHTTSHTTSHNTSSTESSMATERNVVIEATDDSASAQVDLENITLYTIHYTHYTLYTIHYTL